MSSLDLLLIQPPYINYDQERFSLFDPVSYVECHPPLGLAYLAAYCQNGHRIKILDMEAEKMGFRGLLRCIRKYNPRIIGLTATSPLFGMAAKIAKIIKEIKDIPIILGGIHTNFDLTILNDPGFDFVIRKEGEAPLKQLLDYLLNGVGDIRNIKNLSFRQGDKIQHNPEMPLREILDELPVPARELLPMDLYFTIGAKDNPSASMITSRGCPFKCIFCNPVYRNIRRRSVAGVCDEIELLIAKFSIRHIDFFDETFNLDRDWLMKLCNEIIKRGIHISWRARCRVGLFDKELLKNMKQAGCSIISLGIESINNSTLEFLKKGYTSLQVKETVGLIKAEHFDLHGWFILGIPIESREEMKNTISFARKGSFDYALFSILTPMPKTELSEIAIQKGWISNGNNHHRFLHQNKPTLIHPQLSGREILRLTRWAQVSFFLKFSRLSKLIKKVIYDPKEYYRLILRHFIKVTWQ